jgi:hypothetical protein
VRGGTGGLPAADVCVVGAGPAGLTAAHALGSVGQSVIVIESGGSGSDSDVDLLNDGHVVGEPYAGLMATRHRQLGGSANIWNVVVERQRGAKYVPLSPSDLESWPIGWQELEPYYHEAQTVCGLGPFEYGADAWATEARSPFDLRRTGLTSGVYQFGPAHRFTRDLVDELRRMPAVRLVSSATGVGLTFEPGLGDRRVRSVRGVSHSGEHFEVIARTVVLACGAVENARQLMLAGVDRWSGTQWLGRGFMEHARDFSLVLAPYSPEIFAAASFYDFHTGPDGTRIGGRLAITEDARSGHGIPNASLTLVPRAAGGRRHPVVNRLVRAGIRAMGAGRRGRYGWSRMPALSRRFDVFGIVLNLEQRPHASNRIELDERRDRFGNWLPRLFLDWTPAEQAGLERLRELLAEWLHTAGLGRLEFQRGLRPDLSAHHHAGTTRMGRDPGEGVVDPDGRVFGLQNLYVTGGSVFPTAGFANPTLTIAALARRLARHLT